jgi:hypothetical protein
MYIFNKRDSVNFSAYYLDSWINLSITAIIYDYSDYHYTGDGTALFETKDGNWFVHDLEHCSCFGPLDNVKDSMKIFYTSDEILEISKNYGLEDLVKTYINTQSPYSKFSD